MDDIKSWSSFEQRHRNNRPSRDASNADDVTTTAADAGAAGLGIDALYVHGSSPNIAPAAATLLRHSGLTAPTNNTIGDGDNENDGRGDEEEFRLRFHWMRPHPSLAFALEEELSSFGKEKGQQLSRMRSGESSEEEANPAIESSKLMEAYRSSQMKKIREGDDDRGDDRAGGSGKVATETASKGEPNSGDSPSTNNQGANDHRRLPLELPKLRINLTSLVEPPLMSSWLPGEDDIMDSSDSEDDEGG